MTIIACRAAPAAALGAIATLCLLAFSARSAAAMKQNPDCNNANPALCEQIEQCSGGFEANGTCKYIYTVTRYYWKN